MTKSQAKQFAEIYQAQERNLAVIVAEVVLALCTELLAKSDADVRSALHEMHDAATKSKAAGWPNIDLEIQKRLAAARHAARVSIRA